MMLQPEMRYVIAQAVNKMVIAKMLCSEKLKSLCSEGLVVIENFLWRVQGSGAVRGNVHFLMRVLRQWNHA